MLSWPRVAIWLSRQSTRSQPATNGCPSAAHPECARNMQSELRGRSRPMRAAFVMEQALGHATHYSNFRLTAEQQPDVNPVWLPIPFAVSGPARFAPLFRSNWSVRASWRARRALAATRAHEPVDAVLFHTQTTAL